MKIFFMFRHFVPCMQSTPPYETYDYQRKVATVEDNYQSGYTRFSSRDLIPLRSNIESC